MALPRVYADLVCIQRRLFGVLLIFCVPAATEDVSTIGDETHDIVVPLVNPRRFFSFPIIGLFALNSKSAFSCASRFHEL